MFEDDEDIELEETEETEETTDDIPMEFGVDFSTGQLTGGKVRGSQAIAVWAWNALMYPRYDFELSSWEYGSELSSLIGQVMDDETLSMMAESLVEDALLPNPYIEGIDDFSASLKNDKLTVSFTLKTTLGEEALEDVAIL